MVTILQLLISIVGSAGFAALITAFLTHKMSNRKQDVSDFETLVKEYKELNQKLEERLLSTEQELKQLTEEIVHYREQIKDLSNQIVFLQASSNDLPVALWLKNIKFEMLSVNKVFERMFLAPRGFVADDYIGKTDFVIWSREVAEKFQMSDKKVLQTGRVFEFVESIKNDEGETIYIHCTKFPRKVHNHVVGVAGMVHKVYSSLEDVKHLNLKII
jgi:PAS domain S-box-containing protein